MSHAHLLAAPGQLSLSTGLDLLSKQHSCCSPSPGNRSGKGSDQLLPIIQKFLEALPSIGRPWSFDAATQHTIGNACQNDDSNSRCSCNSEITGTAPLRVAKSQAVSWRTRWRDSDSAKQPAKSPVPMQPTVVPVQLLTPASSASSCEPYSCRSIARSLHFAESTGSAPTPSLPTTATDYTSEPGISDCRCRGVFVGNLPGDVDERALVKLFSPCGSIDKLWVARNAANQASLGYGFVVFDSSSGSQAAQLAERDLHGTYVQQQRICVRVSTRNF